MKKTELYGLNQWEASDRIRMEDFNADNLGIETALLGKTGRMELIRTFDGEGFSTIGDGQTMMLCPTLYAPKGDWNSWECIIAVMDFHKANFQEGEVLEVHLTTEAGVSSETVTIPAGSFVAVCSPRHNAANPVRMLILGSGCGTFFLSQPYDDLQFITCTLYDKNHYPPAQTRLVQPVTYLYGIR